MPGRFASVEYGEEPPAGPRHFGVGVVRVSVHAGIQSPLVRAKDPPRREDVPVQPAVFSMRIPKQRGEKAERAGVDLSRMRCSPRPGSQCGEKHPQGRIKARRITFLAMGHTVSAWGLYGKSRQEEPRIPRLQAWECQGKDPRAFGDNSRDRFYSLHLVWYDGRRIL
jgi:hypothetical protein